MNARIAILLGSVLLIAAASLWSTSGFLRKNDQATILAGAVDWSRGDRQAWSRYYQFDKTYVLYAYTAAVLKINRALDQPVDTVRLANRSVALAFWLALFVFVWRYRQQLDPLILIAVLLSPAVLLNTQYVNSSTLSSALLLLSLATVRSRWGIVFFFLAVGARADALLLLPLYGWLLLTFPVSNDWKNRPKSFQRLEKIAEKFPTIGKTRKISSNDWKIVFALAATGLAAFAVGRLWAGGGGTDLDPFFNLRVALGYIVFGFGGATLVFLWLLGRWSIREVELVGWWRVLGALAFALPVLFFLPQLHAPRYFWRAGEAILMVAVLAPTLAALRPQALRAVVALAVLLPVLVGIQMPVLGQTRLTLRAPTLFPSGDGHYPMGAYASFLAQFRAAEQEPIDHNQRVWWAARATPFEADATGRYAIVTTPMYGYLMLSGSLQGLTGEARSFQLMEDKAPYLDSRTLSRADVKFGAAGWMQDVLEEPIEVVSPEFDGISILRLGVGDHTWAQRARLLNEIFAGDEYRIGVASEVVPPAGHRAIWFAEQAFDQAQRDQRTGWYVQRTASTSEGVYVAWAALPDWMSVRAFEE